METLLNSRHRTVGKVVEWNPLNSSHKAAGKVVDWTHSLTLSSSHPHMSSSATANNIKTGIVQSNTEKSVVLMNDPAHGCTHRRTSNIVPTDIHGLSMVHCIHRYPWTVHGTLYPQISMDCPWYIVSADISMDCPWYIVSTDVHCIHRYPWTVHGTLYPQISMDCPVHAPHIHGYPWIVPHTPWGRWLEKLLGNTMYPWISMDCPRTPWGEMAYSGIQCIHGYPWTVRAPHGGDGWKSYPGKQCIHGYPWTVRAPHGGDGWKSYSGIQCIHGYPWTVRAPHGGDGWKSYSGNTMYPWISMDCPCTPWERWLEKLIGNTMYPWISMDCLCTPWGRWLEKLLGNTMYPWISMDCPRTPWGRWLEKLLGNTMYPWISMDIHGLSTHPMGGDGCSGIHCIIIPWTVHAPHGEITHSMGISIARSLDLRGGIRIYSYELAPKHKYIFFLGLATLGHPYCRV